MPPAGIIHDVILNDGRKDAPEVKARRTDHRSISGAVEIASGKNSVGPADFDSYRRDAAKLILPVVGTVPPSLLTRFGVEGDEGFVGRVNQFAVHDVWGDVVAVLGGTE